MSNFNNQNPNSPLPLLDPFVKVTIGNPNSKDADIFTVGDGKLKRVSVTLGEGKVQSNCRFTVLDIDKKLTDKYLAYIEKVGGLDPIEVPQETEQPSTVTSISNSAVDESTPGKVLYENTIASTFGFGERTQGGSIGAYGDRINFNGQYAAMIHPNFVQGAADSEKWRTFYKYAKMRVTNLANNKSTIVTVVSTGPWALGSNGLAARPLRPHPERKIDLTPGAFYALTSPGTPAGLLNVKIEWLEGGTTTPTNSSNTTPQTQTKGQVKQQSAKETQTALTNYNTYRIRDWAAPKVGPTKNIILIPGHLVDSNGGTGGGVSAVTYNGENRPAEGVATQLAVEVFASELRKAGYSVTTPTTSVRNTQVGNSLSSQALAFLDQVAALKANTGAYALELHFDSPEGRSGVIPQRLNRESSGSSLSVMDVALGRDNAFGSFSYNHGNVLAAPRRGISILEIDRLSPSLASPLASGNWQAFKNLMIPYAQKAVAALNTVTSNIAVSQDRANSSVNSSKAPQVENTPAAKTLSGAQITIELGYGGKTIAAYSFIHVGLRYSLFEPNALEFTGQAASWVLTQRVKNTAYKDITFRKLAQKITSSYGMKLEMPEEGPKYDYFPQRGQTDYEALLIEARRIGYRVYTKGATLYIQPRKGIDPNKQVFVLEYGINMGTYFEVTHQASSDSKGGARSSQPGSNNSTGERKFEIDPDTGQVKQKRKENVVGTGNTLDTTITGSPLPLPAPKTTGETNSSDSQRKADEDRIKGIIANAEFPTTPEALTLDPDTPFKTEGISVTLDRYWVVDNITHDYEGGKFTTKLVCYSPMKNKRASADINTGQVNSISNPVVDGNNAAFDPNAPKFIRPTPGVITSKHRTENSKRPDHKGIDYGDPIGTPIQAAAAGTVTTASFGWNGGYGTLIIISHGNGWETRYSHLSQIAVTQGQQVTQGQIIGKTGSTGRSTG